MRSGKWKFSSASRSVDILQNLSGQQLAWIGAVAMAYNEAEECLKVALSNCLGFPWVGNEIVVRIGVGQIPPILLQAVKRLELPVDTVKLAELCLGSDGFPQLKSYRDGVVHAQILDTSKAVGFLPNKGKPDYVLLSTDALKGLYDRLVLMREELKALIRIVAFRPQVMFSAHDDRHKAQLEKSIQAATAELSLHQTKRRRLKPLPSLPKESQPFTFAPQNQAEKRPQKKPPKKNQ